MTTLNTATPTEIRFLSVDEGREELVKMDEFMEAMTPLDYRVRMKTDNNPTKDEYLEFIKSHVMEWTEDKISVVKDIIVDVNKMTRISNMRLPYVVKFILTDGEEEAGAAYCRNMDVVVLPENKFNSGKFTFTFVHELFHIMSRQIENMTLRESLYSIIGFSSFDTWESCLLENRLTNPDAPVTKHCIALSGQRLAPLIVVDNYDNKSGRPFFSFLKVKFRDIDTGKMFDMSSFKDEYMMEIGKNTDYIIHPEETMADNFTHYILETASLETPEIIEKISKLFDKF